MANVKIKRDEFQTGFIRGIAVGLLSMLLAVGTLIGLPLLNNDSLVIVLLLEWLVPAFLVYYYGIKTNSARIGLMASHYCIFIIILLMMLLQYYV
jgi:hypothetical protein